MTDTALDGLRRRIRLTLEHGEAIAFVGWRDNYHDQFTRSIPRERVVFTQSTAPPAHVGFIFFTKNVPRTLRGRISKNRSVSHTLLEPQQIKDLLKEFANTFAPSPSGAARAPQASPDEDVLDVLTRPQELGIMDKFVRAFHAEAVKHDGKVGKRTLGKMVREHGVESAAKLAAGGWVVAEVSKGRTKIGWYRAGPKMEEHEKKVTVLPDDPHERARAILARKDALLAERSKQEAVLAEINRQLELIEKINQTVGELAKLTSLLK